jgi:hypothetical protein
MKQITAQEALGEAMMRGVYDPFSGKIDVEKAKKLAKEKMGRGMVEDQVERFRKIGIAVSPAQLRKLRKGIKVRVKPPMEGMGMYQLVVDPSKYDAISRTFARGAGKEISLTEDELMANREMGGEGIFGKAFDKFLGKIGIKKEVYKFGDMIKGPVKKAIRTLASGAPAAFGSAGAALATAVGQPQLAPLAIMAGKKLGEKARNYSKKHIEGYIDDPEAYQKNPSKFRDLKGVGVGAKKPLMREVRDGARAAVSMAQARADMMNAGLGEPQFSGSGMYVGGQGLYAGAARGRGMGVEELPQTRAITGRGGGMVAMGHPALQSQAMAANFHRQYQTIPQLQKYHQMGGSGLYV